VFFQNDDDLDLFVQARLVKPDVAERLPGSGVDTCKFAPVETGQTHEGFRFLLASRMLWDKGIGEFVDAARPIRRRHPNVQCQLLGFLDVPNPTVISKAQMQAWVDEGIVTYLGTSDRVETLMQAADCIVLPSYREGLSRSLLEAASLGKPIIATDAVGCRDVVDDGINGFLCKPRDAEDLAGKMTQMIGLSEAQRLAMGRRGREKMLREFDERIVIERYLSAIDMILASPSRAELV
jgi:glycosyltransferase involved in cell wall biosynthesis